MYVKIKEDRTLQNMPDLYKASWDLRNDDTTRDFCASHDNWLEKVETPQPPYNPETSYVTDYWQEEIIDGVHKAVQKWEIIPIEPQENISEN